MTTARAAYYLLLIALLMPSLPDGSPSGANNGPAKTAPLTENVVQPAASDDGFCTRQANLCEATSYLLKKFEAKAKYPIHVLSSWAHATTAPDLDTRA